MGDILKHVLKQRQQRRAAELRVESARQIAEERAAAQAEWDAQRKADADRREAQRRAERAEAERRRAAERSEADRKRTAERAAAEQKRERERRTENARREAERKTKEAEDKEKASLGAPVTRHLGGDDGKKAMPVWHHKVPSAPATLKGAPRDCGPAIYIMPTGKVMSAPQRLASVAPKLSSSPKFREWSDGIAPVVTDTRNRYGKLLEKLRVKAWWAEVTGAAGVTLSRETTEYWRGAHAEGTRKVTVIDIPTIIGVKVADDGLRIRIQHRVGDSAENWRRALPKLRSAFGAAGSDASNLRIAEAKDGDVVLCFDDTEPFADMHPKSGDFDAERGRSLLGADKRGHEVWVTWAGSSGMVVGGVPNSGKTASLLPLFAGMAGKAELHVFDGKSGFDLHPLRHLAATYNRTGDIAAPLETLRKLDRLRVDRAEALYKKLNANNFWNVKPADRERLGLVPVFLIIDECQTWTDTSGMDKDERAAAAEVSKLVRTLVQKARSTGIVTVLTTQKPDGVTIPTVIRDNAALKLCFRVSTAEAAITVLGGQAATAPDPAQIPMDARGRFVMETEGRGIVLGQAGYADPDTLEEELKDAEPVPNQAEVVARLLSKPVRTEPESTAANSRPEPKPPEPDTAARTFPNDPVKAEAARMGLIDLPDTKTEEITIDETPKPKTEETKAPEPTTPDQAPEPKSEYRPRAEDIETVGEL
jgi:S-DNA-T family DNA segregation ATPase FtsK/SpoIIIE